MNATYIISLVLFAGMTVYSVIIYVRRQKMNQKTGGTIEGMKKHYPETWEKLQRSYRKEFGMEPGEEIHHTLWMGRTYLGPLVPETEPGLGEQVFDALMSQRRVSRQVRVALTTFNRLLISMEGDATFTMNKLEPAARVSPGHGRILFPHEAFVGSDDLQPYEHYCGDGEQLLHLSMSSGEGFTFWIDENAVVPLRQWCGYA